MGRAYDWLRYKLNPRQKWLKKQIPDDWSDKVWLITELNFAMVVHFVDGEKCFDNTDYEASGENHAKFANELKDCYDYIKIVVWFYKSNMMIHIQTKKRRLVYMQLIMLNSIG